MAGSVNLESAGGGAGQRGRGAQGRGDEPGEIKKKERMKEGNVEKESRGKGGQQNKAQKLEKRRLTKRGSP